MAAFQQKTALLLLIILTAQVALAGSDSSFATFDRRAKAGERLNVVFFGASLTWGANATDPQQTSYRALIGKRLQAAYPAAHFTFVDGAIGGTNSQLGVFRFDRDVLRHNPDLVLLDFSANDGINDADEEKLASYESLVRRVIVDAKAPVVQVIFPFQWDAARGTTDGMKRRDAHLAIAGAYHVPVGDAIDEIQKRIKSGEKIETIWNVDGVHPGDAGYVQFADAAWDALQRGIKEGVVCVTPEKMLHADTYLRNARVRVSSLAPLPPGWTIAAPHVVSAYFDMLMSRWLDDEVVVTGKGAAGSRLRVSFSGSMLMLFGESTTKSAMYRVFIDGKLVPWTSGDGKQTRDEFDAGFLAKLVNGNTHWVQVLKEGLDPATPHTLEIEPVFAADMEQELRLESICVAGGLATVSILK